MGRSKGRRETMPASMCQAQVTYSVGWCWGDGFRPRLPCHVWMWELDCEEDWVLKNWCFWTVVLEKTLESPLDRKAMQPVSPTGNQSEYALERLCWSWNPNTLATWLEELTHLKRPWCLERLRAGGEQNDRGWDSWMASLTQLTWVWVDFSSWWWIGRPGVLQFME